MTNDTVLTHHVISNHNRQRLGSIVDEARRSGMASLNLLSFLEEKLELAECVSPPDVPDDVVTRGSRFCLRDLNTNELQTLPLCYPESVGLSNGGDVSVLDPIGCAVLGRRVGDEIVVDGPSGIQRLRLVEVLSDQV